MNNDERSLIRDLFGKLAEVEHRAPPRDRDAERFIHEQIAAQPGAPYYMAQTIVVQEQALADAQRRIEELEQQAAGRQEQGRGLFGGVWGGGSRPATSPSASYGRRGSGGSVPAFGRSQHGAPGAGGGFLAGAAQTAMGVAGGVLLGNMLAGMFAGDEAQAAEPAAEDPGAEDPGVDDGGFDMGEEF